MNTYFDKESDDKHESSERDDWNPIIKNGVRSKSSERDDRHGTSVIDNNVMESIPTTEEPPIDRVFESFVKRKPKEEDTTQTAEVDDKNPILEIDPRGSKIESPQISEIEEDPRGSNIDSPQISERDDSPQSTVIDNKDSNTTTEPPIDRVFESFVESKPDEENQSVATTTFSNYEDSTDYSETPDVETRELVEYYDIVQYYDTDFNDTIIYETELKNTTIQERKGTTKGKHGYSTTSTTLAPITTSTTIAPSNMREEFGNLTVEQLTQDLIEPEALRESTTVDEESTTSSVVIGTTTNDDDIGSTDETTTVISFHDNDMKPRSEFNNQFTVFNLTETSTTDPMTTMYTSTTSTDQNMESTFASTEFINLLTNTDKETAFNSELRDFTETTSSESSKATETSEPTTTFSTDLGTTTTIVTETTTESTQATTSDDVNVDNPSTTTDLTTSTDPSTTTDLTTTTTDWETTTKLFTTTDWETTTDVSTTTELSTTTDLVTTDSSTTTDPSSTIEWETTLDLGTTMEENTESTVTQTTTGSNLIPSTEFKEDSTIHQKHFNDYSEEILKIDSIPLQTLKIMTTNDLTTQDHINHSTTLDSTTDFIVQTTTTETSIELTSKIEPMKAIKRLNDSNINTLVNEVKSPLETLNLSDNANSSDYEAFYNSNSEVIDRQKPKKQRDDSDEYYVDSISGSVE
ncbi:unnamed protein product [Diamesa hyperborea]